MSSPATWKDVFVAVFGETLSFLLGVLITIVVSALPITFALLSVASYDGVCIGGHFYADVRIEGKTIEMVSVNPDDRCQK